MAAQVFTPNAVAREASKASKSTVTDKQVRGWARTNMPKYSKATHPARQSHEYTAAERTRIVAAFVARAKGNAPAPAATPRKRTRRASAPAPVEATE